MATRKPKTIDQQVAEYRNRLVMSQHQPRRDRTPEERAQRLSERIQRSEDALGKSDRRRLRILLRHARLLNERDDMRALYAITLEIAHICRVQVIGLQETHPVLSTLPPRHLVSTLPPNARTPGVIFESPAETVPPPADDDSDEDQEDH